MPPGVYLAWKVSHNRFLKMGRMGPGVDSDCFPLHSCQIHNLERPMRLEDIFNREEMQRIQDAFSDATGLASIITYPDGTPFTSPSNFTHLCHNIIRTTKKGMANCIKSDACLGQIHPDGPMSARCQSGGLWDAGTSIIVDGIHLGNWLIGQVLMEGHDHDSMMEYAEEIGADRGEYENALARVPMMTVEKFNKITHALYVLAGQLSDQGKQKRELKENLRRLSAAEKRLHDLAHYDTLTGLPNRLFFQEQLRETLHRAEKEDGEFALFFIDLDHFKSINDTYGHYSGDRLLQIAASRLSQIVRPPHIVSRLGGDEFTVILNLSEKRENPIGLANQLLTSLRQPYEINKQKHFLTASIGISLYPEHAKTCEVLSRMADTAMYYQKEHGRNGLSLFQPAMGEMIQFKDSIEKALRQALSADSLELKFQPIHRTKDNSLFAAESLIRINLEEMTGVGPDVFIPIAEETGLIYEIGEWVLNKSCQVASTFYEKYGERTPRFSINVSPRQFYHPDFSDMIDDYLQKWKIPRGMIHLEITEGLLADPSFSSYFERLRTSGIGISIDDFGTGYSSLGYLQQFPVSSLKIDRSFVSQIEHNPSKQSLVRAILRIGLELGIDVVAEGVETEWQRDLLKTYDCPLIQGYINSPALSEQDYLKYADERLN